MNTDISTDRLALQLLALRDADDLFEYARDPLVTRNTAWLTHQTIEDTRAFIHHVLKRQNTAADSLHLTWGIRLNEKVIGTVSFVQEDQTTGHIDYALSQAFWGKGYMTEAVKAVVNWVFHSLPALKQINSGCLSRNIGSMRVLGKAGFKITQRYESERGAKFDYLILETTLFSLDRQDFDFEK